MMLDVLAVRKFSADRCSDESQQYLNGLMQQLEPQQLLQRLHSWQFLSLGQQADYRQFL